MKIIVSPTKNMVTRYMQNDYILKPIFFEKALQLATYLKQQNLTSFAKIFNASDKIIENSIKLYANMNLDSTQLTPAIFAYSGLQFKYADISSMSQEDIAFANQYFYIISAFYGLLKPLDGIVNYRLDFTCKIDFNGYSSLYDFWSDSILNAIDDEVIVNLASDEYFMAIKPYTKNKTIIDVKFYVKTPKGLIQKGTIAKMARGKMMAYIIKNRIVEPNGIRGFNELGFEYEASLSNDNLYMFVKNDK